MLFECLPPRLFDRIQEAQTDPFAAAPESDIVTVRHGGTGEVLKDTPVLKMHRVSRKKFRALCADGISVQVNPTFWAAPFSAYKLTFYSTTNALSISNIPKMTP